MSGAGAEPMVFVVDDDQGMRRSLEWLIESVGLPVEAFDSADAFLKVFDPNRPGCLVLDVRMSGMGGLRLLEHLCSRALHPPVIVLTGHGDVPMAVEALQQGAFQFIEKPPGRQQIVHGIQDALVLDRDRRAKVSERAAIVARLARLTPRESQVLERLIEGEPNKRIALEFGITERTVEKHRGKGPGPHYFWTDKSSLARTALNPSLWLFRT